MRSFLAWWFWLLVFAAVSVGAYREVERSSQWRQWALLAFWSCIAAVIANAAARGEHDDT